MSSRNRYLSDKNRVKAAQLYRALLVAKDRILAGDEVSEVLASGRRFLEAQEFNMDYFAYVEDSVLRPIDKLSPGSSLILAGKLDQTRLIDNMSVA